MKDNTTFLSNITYEIVCESYCDGRLSYGIAICEDGIPIEVISDISNDRGAIEELVKSCNDLRLSPYHIRDVIEDLLNK